MSLTAYLTLKGAKQGEIKGSVKQKGRENQIAVYAVQHEISSPRDAASGQATGKRQHRPIIVTKELDKSSPLLQNALVNNEVLTEVVLRFWSPSVTASTGSGAEVQVYTIKLTNAFITNNHLDMQLNKTDPGTALPVLEELWFVYEKIEWTWNDGGIMASDTWVTAV